jgi:hypothetical protein
VLAGLGVSIGGSEWLFAPELMSGHAVSVLEDWTLPVVSVPDETSGKRQGARLCQIR